MQRTVILHYHLFKNAGTSVDRVLQANFPGEWATAEFPNNDGDNSALVSEWIGSERGAQAFSSHTAIGPLPKVENTRIISLLFLRDPIDRIRSAYRFERTQQADTFGANLAKKHDFEGYVRARLAITGDRQCRNFQTHRLAAFTPGPGTERDRALRSLAIIDHIGLVEDFDNSMQTFAEKIRSVWTEFKPESQHLNQSKPAGYEDETVVKLLGQNNSDDVYILEALRTRAGLLPRV